MYLSNNLQIMILAIYRPPGEEVEDFVAELKNLTKKYKRKNKILLGYININIDYNIVHKDNQDYLNTITEGKLLHTIYEYTRKEMKNIGTRSCIDHVAIGGTFRRAEPFIIQSKISDHCLIGFHYGKINKTNVDKMENASFRQVIGKTELASNLQKIADLDKIGLRSRKPAMKTAREHSAGFNVLEIWKKDGG